MPVSRLHLTVTLAALCGTALVLVGTLTLLPAEALPSELFAFDLWDKVQHALACGLTWLKAFPASVLGSGWFPAMRGPFPQARFVALWAALL